MMAKFLLGELVITKAASKALGRAPLDLIARHAVLDHGKITVREHKRNRMGLRDSIGEVISRYDIDPTDISFCRL